VSVRDRINRLELLLQKIQSHARARRASSPGERRQNDARATAAVPPTEVVAPLPANLPPISRMDASSPASAEFYDRAVPANSLEDGENAPIESLSEEDVVEMSSDVLESVPPGEVAPLPSTPDEIFEETGFSSSNEELPEESAPASSKRHRIATPFDESLGLDAGVPPADEGREVPVKTPPPESGPQEAPAVAFAVPNAPDLDQLLDDLPPVPSGAGPTPEQLGQTIELEDTSGRVLELDSLPEVGPQPGAIAEEFEVTLPRGEYAGSYDEALQPPPEAREELEEHRRKSGEVLAAYGLPTLDEPSLEMMPVPGPGKTTSAPADSRTEPEELSQVEPSQIFERPSLSTSAVVKFTGSAPVRSPATFLALLDSSIGLGGD